MIKLSNLFISFLKLGLTAFGGPAMVAYIKKLAVEKKQWLDEKTFQEGVALAQAVPGATAMQVAAYVGLKSRGLLGGILSFTGFALPAFILMLILSALYEKNRSVSEVISVFTGLQVIVVSIVANATLIFTKPIIKSIAEIFIAILAFILFTFGLNPFIIITLCFIFSQFIFKDSAQLHQINHVKFKFSGISLMVVFFLMLLFSLYLIDNKLFIMATIMAKIDFFAFGGGYASLPLMLHEFVDRLHWIDRKTFIDGIALGQITPGPIVITATFVGYLLKGISGAIVATIYVFCPSFIMISLASEMSEKIRNLKIFIRGKRGLLASFAGLLLFATIKFVNEIEWSLIKITLSLLSFIALYKGVNILYIVLTAILFSLFLFR